MSRFSCNSSNNSSSRSRRNKCTSNSPCSSGLETKGQSKQQVQVQTCSSPLAVPKFFLSFLHLLLHFFFASTTRALLFVVGEY